MAANLSNIAFFDISEDQFKNFIPGSLFQGGIDYYGYVDSDIQGDEYLSTICNFAIQIDVDKKITLGKLGEFFMKSSSFWNLLNKYSNRGQGVSWYEALNTNISNIETLIGPKDDVSDSWDWNDIIIKYNNLIELVYNITGIIGGLGDSNNPTENYETWNTWKPFNQEPSSGKDILGSIQSLYVYLTNILGSDWFKYSNVKGGLNQRVTELENYTGIPITGSSGQTSLKKQIEDINNAMGKKSDKAGTDTVYGRLKQLETLKDSSSQLSDTIGEFSTGSGGDPLTNLTNKVNDLKTKKATIHDFYQYLAPQTYDSGSDSFNTEGGNLNLPNGNNMVSKLFKDSLWPLDIIPTNTRKVSLEWGHRYLMYTYYDSNATGASLENIFFRNAFVHMRPSSGYQFPSSNNGLQVVIPKLTLPSLPTEIQTNNVKSLYNNTHIRAYIIGNAYYTMDGSGALIGVKNVFPVGYSVRDSSGVLNLVNFYSNKVINLLGFSSKDPTISNQNNLYSSDDNHYTLFDTRNIKNDYLIEGGVVGFPYIYHPEIQGNLVLILARMAIIDIWYNPGSTTIQWKMQLIFPSSPGSSSQGVPRFLAQVYFPS